MPPTDAYQAGSEQALSDYGVNRFLRLLKQEEEVDRAGMRPDNSSSARKGHWGRPGPIDPQSPGSIGLPSNFFEGY